MIGIALEGGAERSAFTAGVLDQLMKRNFKVSAVSGTSAGAGCALNFRSRQHGIALEMMTVSKEERYFGMRHMLHTGHFLNLKHMVQNYAQRIDFHAFFSSSIKIDFAATCCEDGSAAYLTDNGSKERLFQTLMASCALPIICDPILVGNRHYLDGSIVAPIPFAHLLEEGCNKVLVVLTGAEGCRPTDYRKFKPLLRRCYAKSYPALYDALVHRIPRYRLQMKLMHRAQKEKRVFVLRPEIAPIPLFTQNPIKIQTYYQHGAALVQQKWHEIEAWLLAEPVLEETTTHPCPIMV